MMIREPAVAGMFYPRDAEQCRTEIETCVRASEARGATGRAGADRIYGGIVPHAGWICSGAVAAGVIREIAAKKLPDVVVVFGAIHVPKVTRAAVFPSGAWETPMGLAQIEARLADRMCGQCGILEASAHAHDREHSIEVEVPFLQHLLPGVPLVPIMAPADEKAAELGAALGRVCKHFGVHACFLGSTDLTHYGPSYRFTPQGVGPEGLAWAKRVNDSRMIQLMLAMCEMEAVNEAATNKSACGGGAIAATIAACKAMGSQRGTLLEHTTSEEVLVAAGYEPMQDSVGYAGIVFE